MKINTTRWLQEWSYCFHLLMTILLKTILIELNWRCYQISWQIILMITLI